VSAYPATKAHPIHSLSGSVHFRITVPTNALGTFDAQQLIISVLTFERDPLDISGVFGKNCFVSHFIPFTDH
jgi:hypothetical protein